MYPQAASAPLAGTVLPRVRVATMADVDEVADIAAELAAENGLTSMNLDLVREAVIPALKGQDGIIGVIGAKPIEAVIMLQLRKFWYSQDVHLEELLSFVRLPFRRSRNAIALIEFAKSAAVRLQMPLLIGIISNEKTAQKIRLYERRLGKPAGGYFLWNGKTGNG